MLRTANKHSSAARFSVNRNQSLCIDVPYLPGPDWRVFAEETQAFVSSVCELSQTATATPVCRDEIVGKIQRQPVDHVWL